MKKVYLALHLNSENEIEDIKIIGIFSSLKTAKDTIALLKKKKGFKNNPKGFSIDEYIIDKTHWKEGFVSIK